MPKDKEYSFSFDGDELEDIDSPADALPDITNDKAPAKSAVQTDDDPEIVFEDEDAPAKTAKADDLALEPLPDEGAPAAPAVAEDPRIAQMAARMAQMEALVNRQQSTDVQAQIKAISDGIASKIATQRSALKDAIESGDSDAAATAQLELSRLAAQETQHNSRVEQWKAQQTEAASRPVPQEQAADAPAFDQRSLQSWLTKNQWFHDQSGRYAQHQKIAKQIDEQVMADGFNPAHPKYYQELSKRLRETFKGNAPGDARKATNTVTAPSRGASNGNAAAANGRRVVLTADDRAMMEQLRIDPRNTKEVAAFAQAKAERLRREAREAR